MLSYSSTFTQGNLQHKDKSDPACGRLTLKVTLLLGQLRLGQYSAEQRHSNSTNINCRQIIGFVTNLRPAKAMSACLENTIDSMAMYT